MNLKDKNFDREKSQQGVYIKGKVKMAETMKVLMCEWTV